MKIDTKNLVSMTDANQNFSQVVKAVEESGDVVILKNNKPKYVVSKFEQEKPVVDENTLVTVVAKMIIADHINAFKELGK